jgi:radical SAM protein with 4Fe4S-binding SPASM domain
MSRLDALPIVLRPEAFGGVLFDPADATFLELDPDGFALLWTYAEEPGRPLGGAAERFLGEVRRSLKRLEGRGFRRIAIDPAASSGPVPTLAAPSLVDFQITDQCHLSCPHCYASSTPTGAHAGMADIELALEQIAEVGAFQVALGGGEPLLHPELERILARCHTLGVVPNLTTSGVHLSDRNLELINEYCGAVGLSIEGVGEHFDRYRSSGFERFRHALDRLLAWRVPTVLQITLNADTFSRLDSIVELCRGEDSLYGVIFLAFKPVGRGAGFGEPLAALAPGRVQERLQEAFFALSEVTRVGFDCCLTPGVTGSGGGFDAHAARYLEGCSALRSSIGLLPNLDVLPCTFTPARAVGNLREQHLREIWRGLASEAFRHRMAERAADNPRCSTCPKYGYCLGGCPVMDLVNCSHDYLAAPPRAG